MARKVLGVAPSGADDVDTKGARDAAISAAISASNLGYQSDSPSDHGLLEWNYDPTAGQGGSALVSGTLHVAKIKPVIGGLVTNLLMAITAAGATLTSGGCHAVLYDSAGVERGRTANMSTTWTSTGLKVMPLGTPYTVVAGQVYYVVILANGTTPPSVMRAGTTMSLLNAGQSGASNRFGVSGTAVAAAPSSITPASMLTSGALSLWVALS